MSDSVLRGEADHHHPARRRQGLEHLRRRRDVRERRRACVSRSFTTWRARPSSVPGSKIISIRDRPGTDSERMTSRNATPLSRSCSSGHGDELLDLLGGEPERLGLHLHRDRRELGQRVPRHARGAARSRAPRRRCRARRPGPSTSDCRRPANASSDATSRSGGSKRGLRQRVVGSRCPHDPNGGVSQVHNPADAWAWLGAESRQRIPPKGPNGAAEASPFHALWSIGCRQWQKAVSGDRSSPSPG